MWPALILACKVGEDDPHYLTPPCLVSCMAFVSVYLWVVGWSGGKLSSNDLNGNALDEEHQPKNRSNVNDNTNVNVNIEMVIPGSSCQGKTKQNKCSKMWNISSGHYF
ncbi:hypothetical protein HZH66_000683 [Vespula vulgaris]|uniref:Uncharacterized protein n=1 Tax=Vespula vulgaris TaxID=7454 RepID=A0A834KRX5_VESVU|nr:hypothetical protein HZH66_000683 [Vespula vulgaris]